MSKPQRSPLLPAPPVPADADLRAFAFMPLDVNRLCASDFTAIASGDEFRAAVLLWCASWHQVPAASLPDDDRVLSSLAGLGRDLVAWSKVRTVALHGWIRHADGRLYHQVIVEKAKDALRRNAVFQERSKQGNNARWESSRKDPVRIHDGSRKDSLSVLKDKDKERDIRETPAVAAAAQAIPPPRGNGTAGAEVSGDTTRATGAALPPGGGTHAAAAAAPNPDANAKLRVMLGRHGMAASPQATIEWEGMLRYSGIRQRGDVDRFLKHCAITRRVTGEQIQFARQAEDLVDRWKAQDGIAS